VVQEPAGNSSVVTRRHTRQDQRITSEWYSPAVGGLQCRRVEQVARFLVQLQHYCAREQQERSAPPEQTVLAEGGADPRVRHWHEVQVVSLRKERQ
jgi:hypothetical protein